MARKSNEIDRDKLRAAVRKLGDEEVRYMLDDAIELLPPTKLLRIAKKYLDLGPLRPDPEKATEATLLAENRRGIQHESPWKRAVMLRWGARAVTVSDRRHTPPGSKCIVRIAGGDGA